MNKRSSFIRVPSVTYPIIFLAIVVLVTAFFTGGIAGQTFGGQMSGAKRYLGVFGAILGYFALTAQPIPPHKAGFYASLFMLSGLTAVASNVIYALGPSAYFLFILFPSTIAYLQAVAQETFVRLTGISFAALALYCWMIMRYTIRGLFDLGRPWRMVAFIFVAGLCMLGGYRAIVVLMAGIFLFQFYLEGLVRSRFFPIMLMAVMLAGTGVIAFIDKMPLSVQRSLSFLPIEVDYLARYDAYSTMDWRLVMWKTVLPDVPKYLLLGKGFGYSITDFHLTQEAVRRGYYSIFEDTMIAGNYHHGILTLIIPFGIFGVIAFLWFGIASIRALHRNYQYGDPALRPVNMFLYGYFFTRFVFYVVLYGQFDLDFVLFTGVIGLSLAINHGIRGPHSFQEPVKETAAEPALA